MTLKKVLALVLALTVTAGAAILLTACNDKETVPSVESISAKLAEDVDYSVGDVFDIEDVVVTAKLSDGTSKAVTTTAAIEYVFADGVLDKSGKFTAATAETPFVLSLAFAGKTTTLEIAVGA